MDNRPENMVFQDLDLSNPEIVSRPDYRRRRCSVMVEILDNRISAVDLKKMMEAGMNVAKVKTSFSTEGEMIRILGTVDKAAATCSMKNKISDWPVATSGALKTSIIQTGILRDNLHEVELKEGAEVILTNDVTKYNECNEKLIFVDSSELTAEINVGMEINLNEEQIVLYCIDILDEQSIKCVVSKGGMLTSMLTVCVRGMKRVRPFMTDKDLQIIKFCVEYQVDMLIIYYVRHVDTIKQAKKFMSTFSRRRPLIFSGICTQQGLDNIDDILEESDGIIFPREYLTYELEKAQQYRMPQIQKWIAGKCQQAGKPLYISGGIFGDIVASGVVSDNQIADVTNALLDGVTGFCLNKGDDIGHLVDSIYALNEVSNSVEPILYRKNDFWRLTDEVKVPLNAAEAAIMSCAAVAIQTNARLIILPTVTGRSAKALLRMQPYGIVITVSTDVKITRLLSMYRCTVPLVYNGPGGDTWFKTVQARVDFALQYAVSNRWVDFGHLYVTLSRGSDTTTYCDTVGVWKVDIQRKTTVECPDEINAENYRRESYFSL